MTDLEAAIDPDMLYTLKGSEISAAVQMLMERKDELARLRAICRSLEGALLDADKEIFHQALLILQHKQDEAVRAARWWPTATLRQWASVWISCLLGVALSTVFGL